jgi:ribosomal 50S subunit-associated protein YjgA (DUF615 family)
MLCVDLSGKTMSRQGQIDLALTSLRTYIGMDRQDALWYINDMLRYTDPEVLNAAIGQLSKDEQQLLDELLDQCDQLSELLD